MSKQDYPCVLPIPSRERLAPLQFSESELVMLADSSLPDPSSSSFPILLGFFADTLREQVNIDFLLQAYTILTRVSMFSLSVPIPPLALFGTNDTAVRSASSIRSLVKDTSRFFR